MIVGLGGEEEEVEAPPGRLLMVRVPPGGLLVGLSMARGPPSGLAGGLKKEKNKNYKNVSQAVNVGKNI